MTTYRDAELDHQSIHADNRIVVGDLLEADVVIVDLVPGRFQMEPLRAHLFGVGPAKKNTVVSTGVAGWDYHDNRWRDKKNEQDREYNANDNVYVVSLPPPARVRLAPRSLRSGRTG